MLIRRAHAQLANEDVTQILVVILSRMDSDVFAMLIEDLHHERQSDDFRPCAEDRHYLHILCAGGEKLADLSVCRG